MAFPMVIVTTWRDLLHRDRFRRAATRRRRIGSRVRQEWFRKSECRGGSAMIDDGTPGERLDELGLLLDDPHQPDPE
jgi:hypothetical protein